MPARTKMTPAVRTRIADLMRAGGFLGPAAEMCGISRATAWRWYQQDEDFRRAIDHASAEAEHRCLLAINRGDDDWLPKAVWLSRRFPRQWGWQRRWAGPGVPGFDSWS